jgi:mannose-6-phosphate isomerase-like protein (cupin superfamily)
MERPASQPDTNYHVQRIELVLKTPQVLARVFTLVAGDRIPWHFHKLSSDHYFVLSGRLTIATDFPSSRVELAVGQRYRIDPVTHHEVSNEHEDPAQFLLLQGDAGYDWNKVER